MKRNLTVALTAMLALTLLLSAGCGKGNVGTSPSPALTPPATTKLTPVVTESPMPDLSPAGSPEMSPVGSPGGVIEGFVEGGEVDPSKVPDVVAAVKAEYPNATIKSITYALHNTAQVYEVTLENETKKVYVSADGTIVKNGNG